MFCLILFLLSVLVKKAVFSDKQNLFKFVAKHKPQDRGYFIFYSTLRFMII